MTQTIQTSATLQQQKPRTLNALRIGFAFSCLIAFWHAGWSALVAFGAAQGLLDWIFQLHFIAPIYKIQQFSFETAVALVAVTSVVSFFFAYVFVLFLNMMSVADGWFID